MLVLPPEGKQIDKILRNRNSQLKILALKTFRIKEGGIEPLFGARGRDMRRRDGAAVKIEATSFF